ncbi:MAG TPA: hypothetical protein VK157_07850, partial [Phycisphaerales bacterium]|nr:hypothetical protein [Phycisphaerales bacterium]
SIDRTLYPHPMQGVSAMMLAGGSGGGSSDGNSGGNADGSGGGVLPVAGSSGSTNKAPSSLCKHD